MATLEHQRPGIKERAPRLIPEYFAVLPGFADQELWPRTLLTNGLFRRDKQRAGAARPTFSPQTETTRPALPGLASRKNPVLWAFFRVFMWPVNRQTAFRNKYLRPQELPALGNRLLEAVSQSWMGEGGKPIRKSRNPIHRENCSLCSGR
jgi:hypothetical protein